jgi:hypothetical protein
MLAEALNHRLMPEFLSERFEHYGRIARALRVRDTEYLATLDEFLRRRPAAVRALAARYLPDGRSYRCELSGPRAIRYRVDGFPVTDRYEGWYFEGMPIRVAIESSGERFAGWLVDGQPFGGTDRTIELAVRKDTRIEAVFH